MRLQSPYKVYKCFYWLEEILRIIAISKILKVRMYLTLLIQPIAHYGAKVWSLRKTGKLRMAVFERKVSRKIDWPYFNIQTRE